MLFYRQFIFQNFEQQANYLFIYIYWSQIIFIVNFFLLLFIVIIFYRILDNNQYISTYRAVWTLEAVGKAVHIHQLLVE